MRDDSGGYGGSGVGAGDALETMRPEGVAGTWTQPKEASSKIGRGTASREESQRSEESGFVAEGSGFVAAAWKLGGGLAC
jgi:hypothetical protein